MKKFNIAKIKEFNIKIMKKFNIEKGKKVYKDFIYDTKNEIYEYKTVFYKTISKHKKSILVSILVILMILCLSCSSLLLFNIFYKGKSQNTYSLNNPIPNPQLNSSSKDWYIVYNPAYEFMVDNNNSINNNWNFNEKNKNGYIFVLICNINAPNLNSKSQINILNTNNDIVSSSIKSFQ